MKNFIKSGVMTTVTVSADVESGEPIAIGTQAGVAAGKYLNGEVGEFQRTGVFEFAKDTSTALVKGTVYGWDATNKKIVAALSGDFDLGVAEEAALAADEKGKILVNGLPGMAL